MWRAEAAGADPKAVLRMSPGNPEYPQVAVQKHVDPPFVFVD